MLETVAATAHESTASIYAILLMEVKLNTRNNLDVKSWPQGVKIVAYLSKSLYEHR
jgi:hypothetical protein